VKLSGTQKQILAALAYSAEDTTAIGLAKTIGRSVQTVRLAIGQLEAGGYIDRKDNRMPYAYKIAEKLGDDADGRKLVNKAKAVLLNPTEEDKKHPIYSLFLPRPKSEWAEISKLLSLIALAVKEMNEEEALVITLDDVV
jgi:predicted transcriptional regulator